MNKSALLAGTAMSAALGGPALAQDVLPIPSQYGFSWNGVYVGGHGGALLGDADRVGCQDVTHLLGEGGGAFEGPSNPCGPFSFNWVAEEIDELLWLDDDYVAFRDNRDDDKVRWLGGGQIGIRRQYGGLVVGLEGDFSGVFGDNREVTTFDYYHDLEVFVVPEDYEGTGRVEVGVDWVSTMRASVGVALGAEGRFLPYVTGGLALAGVSTSTAFYEEDVPTKDWCQNGCFFDDDDDIQVGFAVGAGGEYALTNYLSVGVQYLFMHFEDDNSVSFHGDDGRGFDVPTGIENIHQVTGRVNFKLSGWGQ